MSKRKRRPNIFTYHDYRGFLVDWVKYLEHAHALSLRGLAKQASVSSGYMPMVLAGIAPFRKKALAKLAPHLHLNGAEVSHLEQLRELAEAARPEARVMMLKRLQRKKRYRRQYPKEFETYRYMSAWHFVAIRELATVPDFKPDADWIQPGCAITCRAPRSRTR